MVRARLAVYRNRIRTELEKAFIEERPPHDVAASFAIGVFITALPTLGAGLLLFVAIAYLSDRVSKIALFASVVVLNPVAKWGVYGTSFWVGSRLLGPVPGVTLSEITYSAGPDLLLRLLVGNLILAVVLAIIGYVVVLRLINEFRRRTSHPGDTPTESVSE